jgi:hypothetical protein
VRRSLPLIAWPLIASLLAACATGAGRMVPVDVYRADVAWLADDAREGRDTGSAGLQAAAEWVAEGFEDAGLEPLGDDGGWLQHFSVQGSRRLSPEGNVLVLGDRTLELGKDWRPLRSALSASVSGPVVFAGYGLSDAEGGWDDYAALDVKDKVVAVLRKGPRSDVPGTRYAESDPPGSNRARDQLGFASKINNAFRHGAAALLVINDPAHYGRGLQADEPQRSGFGSEGVTASLPAASLSAAAGGAALGLDLAALQRELDEGGKPQVQAQALAVQASVAVNTERPQLPTANVVGWLPGNDPALAGEYVLIGAHMDHLGLGNGSSRGGQAAMGQIHNGADDNASGTAGLVGVARVLGAHRDELRRAVVFAAWSGEELGLLGSRHFASHPPLPLEQLAAVVNMDMIGRSKDGYVTVEGVGTSPGFSELVTAAHAALGLGLDLHLAQRPSDNSDQASFYEKDVPVLNFFTGLHEDYHMPSDDADKINAATGAAIASFASEVVCRLAKQDQRPAFVRVAAASSAVATGNPSDPHAAAPPGTVVNYGVVFGTSPDMAYEKEDGVRIASVRPGTPAEGCGLKPGDVIVAFDGKPVRSLEDYTTLLFSHRPGDHVTVDVRRGTEVLQLQAVLAAPSSGGN